MADDPTTTTTETVDDTTPDVVDDTATVEDDTPLGPKGEKALESLKEERRKLKADLAARDAELDELRRAQMGDHEKAIDDARRAARAEALGEANSRLFTAEVKAAATGKLADPDLLADPAVALKLLGLGDFPTTESGDIDAAAIADAVGHLIEAKPYLAASATPVLPTSIDQGARTTSTAQPSIDEQIAEAEAANDWKRAGSLKTTKMLTP